VSPSGAEYVVHDTLNEHNNFTTNSAENFTITETFKVIRQGSATPEDDFTVKALFHLTVNANGDVTAVVGRSEAECK
jgi:hypothetical protein